MLENISILVFHLFVCDIFNEGMALFKDVISRSLEGLQEVDEVLCHMITFCTGLSAERGALAHRRLWSSCICVRTRARCTNSVT